MITLTSDFGKQTQGIGNMEAVIYGISPKSKVIHLMHGLPEFDISSAARTMETVRFIPKGIHVCIVDPGVGTKRKAVIIRVKRGDYLVGPDNGCLMTAPRVLGGIDKVVEITNEKYMITPVSAEFHGRHIFAPVAAYLDKGVKMDDFGKEIAVSDLTKPPYDEAIVSNGEIKAMVIHINHFGSLHLNVLGTEWDKLGLKQGDEIQLGFKGKKLIVPFCETFGYVKPGNGLVLKDAYGRIEVAINLGSFAKKYSQQISDNIVVRKLW